MLFICTGTIKSRQYIILLRKKCTYFSQSLKQATENEDGLRLHFSIQKRLLTNFKTKTELPPILSSYSSLSSGIFTDVYHAIVDASSIIFNLRRQFFTNAKIFELEQLDITLDVYTKRASQYQIWMVPFTSFQISIPS